MLKEDRRLLEGETPAQLPDEQGKRKSYMARESPFQPKPSKRRRGAEAMDFTDE